MEEFFVDLTSVKVCFTDAFFAGTVLVLMERDALAPIAIWCDIGFVLR